MSMFLYVWSFICGSYYPGHLIAVVESVDQARQVILDHCDDIDRKHAPNSMVDDPDIYPLPWGLIYWGGD